MVNAEWFNGPSTELFSGASSGIFISSSRALRDRFASRTLEWGVLPTHCTRSVGLSTVQLFSFATSLSNEDSLICNAFSKVASDESSGDLENTGVSLNLTAFLPMLAIIVCLTQLRNELKVKAFCVATVASMNIILGVVLLNWLATQEMCSTIF